MENAALLRTFQSRGRPDEEKKGVDEREGKEEEDGERETDWN